MEILKCIGLALLFIALVFLIGAGLFATVGTIITAFGGYGVVLILSVVLIIVVTGIMYLARNY